MKIVDLCCGMGGWSEPFVEDGHFVVGFDIIPTFKKYYPGTFVLGDIRHLDGNRFKDFDLIVGSPPCAEFSILKVKSSVYPEGGDIEKGMELIDAFNRIVEEAQPKAWVMENVERLKEHYNRKPTWHFKISKAGKRCLWSSFEMPPLTPHFTSNRVIKSIPGWTWDTRGLRAKIPYPMARYVANVFYKEVKAPIPPSPKGKGILEEDL